MISNPGSLNFNPVYGIRYTNPDRDHNPEFRDGDFVGIVGISIPNADHLL